MERNRWFRVVGKLIGGFMIAIGSVMLVAMLLTWKGVVRELGVTGSWIAVAAVVVNLAVGILSWRGTIFRVMRTLDPLAEREEEK